MQFFSMDNIFFRTVGKMVDLVWLNVLTLICCIPVVTAGASLTAMYSVQLKLVKNEESSIFRGFIKAFKDNFKISTKTWLAMLALLVFYLADISLLRQGIMQGYGYLEKAIWCIVFIMVLIPAIGGVYIFPLFARYDKGIKDTVKNGYLLACAFFPRTLCMLIIDLFPFALMMLSDYFMVFWIFYGFSFPGFCKAKLLIRIFEKTEDASKPEENPDG